MRTNIPAETGNSGELRRSPGGGGLSPSHWSQKAGALSMVRSLLTKELLEAGNSEMADWFIAVIEDVEHEAAASGGAHSLEIGCEVMLDKVAARIYIAGRKSSGYQR